MCQRLMYGTRCILTSTARALMCANSERSKDLQLSWATASSSSEIFGAVESAKMPETATAAAMH
jgi:hypothetical protein